ncbi:MAG TPA: hypothetical protein VG897_16385, partial [Terriglobales bacterium]|nr:hypothetical protein [Terriglobales bacterium]
MDVHKIAAWAQILCLPPGLYCAYGVFVQLHPEWSAPLVNPVAVYTCVGAFAACAILVLVERVTRKSVNPQGQAGTNDLMQRDVALSSISVLRSIDPETIRNRRSPQTTTESRIGFFNRSNKSVDIFWITKTGDRKYFETIEPDGEWWSPKTYQGHLWLIVQHGRDLVGFEVLPAGTNIAVITGSFAKTGTAQPDHTDAAQRLDVTLKKESTSGLNPILDQVGVGNIAGLTGFRCVKEPPDTVTLFIVGITNRQTTALRVAHNVRAMITYEHEADRFTSDKAAWVTQEMNRDSMKWVYCKPAIDLQSDHTVKLVIAGGIEF